MSFKLKVVGDPAPMNQFVVFDVLNAEAVRRRNTFVGLAVPPWLPPTDPPALALAVKSKVVPAQMTVKLENGLLDALESYVNAIRRIRLKAAAHSGGARGYFCEAHNSLARLEQAFRFGQLQTLYRRPTSAPRRRLILGRMRRAYFEAR
jgi:hypothetical protein